MQSAKPLQYVEMEPSPAVRDVVMSYWGFAVHALPTPDFVHRIWPDGCVVLAMGFSQGVNHIAAVSGVSTVAANNAASQRALRRRFISKASMGYPFPRRRLASERSAR